MVQMSEMQDKDFEARKPFFGLGAHEVFIESVEAGEATTGSVYLQFELLGEDDATGNCRLYLTEKTADRTRSILGAIAVHNKEKEADKQKVRDEFKKITDSDQMTDAKFLAQFKDMQAWILTEEDKNAPKPNGGYYLRNNLYSYEPTPRKTIAEDLMSGATPVADDDDIPFKD